MILILSADAVAAALLGALIETLGYPVRFARPPETARQSVRRIRPRVCMFDCDDPSMFNDETIGRTAMRGISVVVFGTNAALERVRALVLEHDMEMLLVPAEPEAVRAALDRALKRAG